MIPLEAVEIFKQANTFLISEVGKSTNLALICNWVKVFTIRILTVSLSIQQEGADALDTSTIHNLLTEWRIGKA